MTAFNQSRTTPWLTALAVALLAAGVLLTGTWAAAGTAQTTGTALTTPQQCLEMPTEPAPLPRGPHGNGIMRAV
jgi:hypothetical protein